MTEELSNIEVQLIRSALLTKTDQEIAELLELPVEVITLKINDLTDGQAEQRSADVRRFKIEDAERKRPKARPSKVKIRKKVTANFEDDMAVVRGKRKSTEIKQQEEFRQAQKRKLEARRTCKTKVVDYSQMISIKVDIKSWVLVPKGTNEAEAIALYQANRMIKEKNNLKSQFEKSKNSNQ